MDYFFLGEAELVTAFRFIGIDGMAIRDCEEAIAAFRKITEGFSENEPSIQGAYHCHILLLTEEVADWLGELMIEWQLSGKYPLLVEIPGLSGKLAGRKTLVESIREAIGIHV